MPDLLTLIAPRDPGARRRPCRSDPRTRPAARAAIAGEPLDACQVYLADTLGRARPALPPRPGRAGWRLAGAARRPQPARAGPARLPDPARPAHLELRRDRGAPDAGLPARAAGRRTRAELASALGRLAGRWRARAQMADRGLAVANQLAAAGGETLARLGPLLDRIALVAPMRAPEFWANDTLPARLLAPLGQAYAWRSGTRRRLARPASVGVPVICVGNLVVGGAGKTPVAMALASRLIARGRRPHFLTRGYGGRLAGPVLVDPARHDVAAVGDEALLLAELAPTWCARDRVAGARAAAAAGAGLLIMDDGFQNPRLRQDLGLLVVDGSFGFGNRRPVAGGPAARAAGRGICPGGGDRRARRRRGRARAAPAAAAAPAARSPRPRPRRSGPARPTRGRLRRDRPARQSSSAASPRPAQCCSRGTASPITTAIGGARSRLCSPRRRPAAALCVTTAKDRVRLPRIFRRRSRFCQ